MQSYKKEFAEFLVRAEALQFGEFALKSGRNSPYFFNSSKFNTGPLIEELVDTMLRQLRKMLQTAV